MIFRSTDRDDISRIVNLVHKRAFCDLAPDIYEPDIREDIVYMMNGEKTGVIILEPFNTITCRVHIYTTPELWGYAEDFVKEAMAWGFSNTLYQKAVGIVPVFNRLVIRLAKKCGFKEEGLITDSFLKNWKFCDQVLLGETKTEFLLKQRGEISWEA